MLSPGVQDHVAVEPLSPETAMQKRKSKPKQSMKSLTFVTQLVVCCPTK